MSGFTYFVCKLICQKSAHVLSAKMALQSSFFKLFTVLGMYIFGVHCACQNLFMNSKSSFITDIVQNFLKNIHYKKVHCVIFFFSRFSTDVQTNLSWKVLENLLSKKSCNLIFLTMHATYILLIFRASVFHNIIIVWLIFLKTLVNNFIDTIFFVSSSILIKSSKSTCY